MQRILDRRFFERNDQKAVKRYLAGLGFDVDRAYRLEKSTATRFVKVVQDPYVVEDPVEPVKVAKPKKKVAKKESRPDVRKRMKAAVKKIKASRSK